MENVTTIIWEGTKDELYTYFGKCLCGASFVIVGSKYCSECGKRITNTLRTPTPITNEDNLK